MKRSWGVLGPVLVGLVAAQLGLAAAARTPVPTLLDLSLGTGRWSWGFGDGEEPLPATFRWSRARAGLELPLDAGASPEGRLEVRAARFVDSPARIEVWVNGVVFGHFEARPGGFKRHSLSAPVPAGPLTIELRSDDPERGVALDWVRLSEVPLAIPWRVPWAHVGPAALGGALALAGAGPALAAAAALGAALAIAAFAAWTPFATAHALATAGAVSTASLLLVATGVRLARAPAGLVALFALSLAIKSAALFHPSYFYPDARQNHRLVHVLADAEGGGLEERTRAMQERLNVAYPRIVAGQPYAFPYSAVFYLPFTAIESGEEIVRAIAATALIAAALECLATYALALPLLGRAGGLLAAAVSLLLPPLQSRLLYAMWSTVAGHLLDVLAVLALMAWLRRPGPLRLALLWAAAQAALLTYVSSLLNMGALCVAALAALWLAPRERTDDGRPLGGRLAWQAVAAFGLAAVVAIGLLYSRFVILFVTEIVPALLAGGGVAPDAGAPVAAPGLADAVLRVGRFAGPLAAALAVAGWWRLLNADRGGPQRVALTAYLLAFAVLVALRGLGGGLFRDLKEVEFAAPLLAIGAAASLDAVARRGRAGLAVAVVLGVGLVAAFSRAWLLFFDRHTPLAGL
jgi:hypothetical protein